jgi:hypothetical protein
MDWENNTFAVKPFIQALSQVGGRRQAARLRVERANFVVLPAYIGCDQYRVKNEHLTVAQRIVVNRRRPLRHFPNAAVDAITVLLRRSRRRLLLSRSYRRPAAVAEVACLAKLWHEGARERNVLASELQFPSAVAYPATDVPKIGPAGSLDHLEHAWLPQAAGSQKRIKAFRPTAGWANSPVS